MGVLVAPSASRWLMAVLSGAGMELASLALGAEGVALVTGGETSLAIGLQPVSPTIARMTRAAETRITISLRTGRLAPRTHTLASSLIRKHFMCRGLLSWRP